MVWQKAKRLVLHNRRFLGVVPAQTVGDGTTRHHLQPLCNPVKNDGPFVAETPAEVNQRASQFSFGAWQFAGNSRIAPTRCVRCPGKRLEQRLDDVMWLITVKQFEVQVAAGFVGEGLEKFARQAEAKRARRVLEFLGFGNALLGKFVQAAPDQMRSPAKINDAARQTFVHGHESFAGERVFWMKPRAVTADAFFVAERERERVTERDAAILDRVMRV